MMKFRSVLSNLNSHAFLQTFLMSESSAFSEKKEKKDQLRQTGCPKQAKPRAPWRRDNGKDTRVRDFSPLLRPSNSEGKATCFLFILIRVSRAEICPEESRTLINLSKSHCCGACSLDCGGACLPRAALSSPPLFGAFGALI